MPEEENVGTAPAGTHGEIENGILNMVIVLCNEKAKIYNDPVKARLIVADYLDRLSDHIRTTTNDKKDMT